MIDSLSREINDILVDTFRSILRYEEAALKKLERIDLSISEVHLLEAVGKGQNEPKSIGGLAAALGITPPSVTAAINKLVKKGYVEKLRGEHDARVVNVLLTHQGQKVDMAHRYFHEKMVRTVVKTLSEQEKEAMLHAITNLNAFFMKKVSSLEE